MFALRRIFYNITFQIVILKLIQGVIKYLYVYLVLVFNVNVCEPNKHLPLLRI